jgi:hypothetical protein
LSEYVLLTLRKMVPDTDWGSVCSTVTDAYGMRPAPPDPLPDAGIMNDSWLSVATPPVAKVTRAPSGRFQIFVTIQVTW